MSGTCSETDDDGQAYYRTQPAYDSGLVRSTTHDLVKNQRRRDCGQY
jgi:hypothetical protein